MRRYVALLIALAPFGLVPWFASWAPSAVWPVGGRVVLGIGVWLTLTNAYLGWLRPWLHVRKGRSAGTYTNVSAVPLVGTVLLTVGQGLEPLGWPWAAGLLVLLVLDSGGPLWFVLAVWHDDSFWAGG